MRWLAFLIAVLLTITVQTALAPRMRVGGVQPDFVLIVVVFFALYAPGLDAVLAGWVLGLAADFQSIERFGLLAIGYALIALGIYAVRPYLFRRHPLAQVFVTCIGGLLLYGLLFAALQLESAVSGVRVAAPWRVLFGVPLYSALVAPLVQRMMLPAAGLLGVETANYTHARTLRIT